jgi:hypothetical protein
MNYYTYAYLREDGTPYYIGKGKGKRVHSKQRKIKSPVDNLKIIFLKKDLTEEEAFKHEIYMISMLGRKDIGTGILRNLTNGGEGGSGYVKSEETKRKISQSQLGEKNHRYGKKYTDEEKIIIGERGKGKNLGKKHTEEFKTHLSESRKGNRNPFYGKSHTEKSREKLRESHLGVSKHNEESKLKISKSKIGKNNSISKWWRITFKNGEEIVICGLTTWSKENGYDESAIHKIQKGVYKKHKDIVKVEKWDK